MRWPRTLFLLILAAVCFYTSTVPAVAQELQYLSYDNDVIPTAAYKARRQAFMDSLQNHSGGRGNCYALLVSSAEKQRNADVNYKYRQDDNFYYLTGINEPNMVLLLAPGGMQLPDPADNTKPVMVREVLFVLKGDPYMENYTGKLYGMKEALTLGGFEYALPMETLGSLLDYLSPMRTLYYPVTMPGNADHAELIFPIDKYIAKSRTNNSNLDHRDPSSILFSMRAIKSAAEISMVRKATQISVLGHKQAMQSVEPGMYEYQLQAVYEYVFTEGGAEYTGYPCIVGAGTDGTILHYEKNRKKIDVHDMIVSDCGAEYHNYSSDVTRSYPASGKFSTEQTEIYGIVLDAQKAAIAKMKPGANYAEVQQVTDEIITRGLLKLGIMKDSSTQELRKFYPHGVGHPVGLNVHDTQLEKYARRGNQTILQPGMIFTVEPGIYIKDGTPGVPAKYYNIGVRIEDVILVTANGYENMSDGAPREIKDIEALMKKKGIGNTPLQEK